MPLVGQIDFDTLYLWPDASDVSIAVRKHYSRCALVRWAIYMRALILHLIDPHINRVYAAIQMESAEGML